MNQHDRVLYLLLTYYVGLAGSLVDYSRLTDSLEEVPSSKYAGLLNSTNYLQSQQDRCMEMTDGTIHSMHACMHA